MANLLVNISLRAWHPSMSAVQVAAGLGVDPEYSRSIGEPRAAPNGRLLGGINEQTYLWAWLGRKEWVALGDRLESLYEGLRDHHDFIREVVSTGGEVEFYVSVFLKRMGGFSVDCALVRKFAETGIGLSVELYPEPEPDSSVPQPGGVG